MTFAAVPIPAGEGFDTIAVLTATSLPRLSTAGMKFAIRYGSDLSLAERDEILPVMPLVLVQHVERPSWIANPENGDQHGAAAVAWATRLEYPKGAHIALDLEGLGDAGAPVVAHVRAWAARVRAGGWLVCLYVGYLDGLALAQLAELVTDGTIDVLWSDYGARTAPPGVGFVMKQNPQSIVAGVEVDVDTCIGADLRGKRLFGMAIAPELVAPDPGDPHVDPSGPTVGGLPLPFSPDTQPPEAT